MRIHVDYNDEPIIPLLVTKAELINNFVIKVVFSDGTEKLVDFEPFLMKAVHPEIKKYLEPKNFSQFKIVDGNLNWNDYDMIFPLDDLYSGVIS